MKLRDLRAELAEIPTEYDGLDVVVVTWDEAGEDQQWNHVLLTLDERAQALFIEGD